VSLGRIVAFRSAVVQITKGILLQEISEKENIVGKHCQITSIELMLTVEFLDSPSGFD
jgi:hypothetical protein